MADREIASTAALRRALDEVEEARATQRLMVAIAYNEGVSQTALAEWYGLSRKTVYNWLERFETDPPLVAARDAPRPGRPPKLTPDQRESLERTLRRSPREAGYDHDTWTVALLQAHLHAAYDVDYAASSVRRLMQKIRE